MELGAAGRALYLLETLSRVRSANLETLSREADLPKATALLHPWVFWILHEEGEGRHHVG